VKTLVIYKYDMTSWIFALLPCEATAKHGERLKRCHMKTVNVDEDTEDASWLSSALTRPDDEYFEESKKIYPDTGCLAPYIVDADELVFETNGEAIQVICVTWAG
jgi:hypothetical protein